MDTIQKELLEAVSGLHEIPVGAYNIRTNGKTEARNSTEHIEILPRESGDGIIIKIKPGTKNESVHIPVVLSQAGLKETVYNDFYIGDDCDVTIIAGCGIHCGFQSKICGETLRNRRWKRSEDHESGDHHRGGRKQLHGNGYSPDQRCGFYDP